ncbi:MAG: hypothetical protein JXQ71_08835 [Verrucomicrobia bacterium]|nr:hypothetical protein [Verrucomicrobiota bacterium]
MKRPANTRRRPPGSPWPAPAAWGVAVAFFVGFFFYVALRVEPAVEYQHEAPAFRLGGAFLKPYLRYPGGPVDYGAAFLAQLNFNSGWGAMVFTLAGALLFVATLRVVRGIRGQTPLLAPYGPPFLLLLLRDRYSTPSLAIALGLVLSIATAAGYAMLPATRAWPRVMACWLGAALLCYAGGVWPCVLFVALATLAHAPRRREWRPAWGCGLAALLAPAALLAFAGAVPVKVPEPLSRGVPESLSVMAYLVLAGAAVVIALWPSRPVPIPQGPRTGRDASRPGRTGNVPWAGGSRRVLAAGLMVAGWAAVGLAFDGRRKTLAEVDYHASRGHHDKVLAAAGRLKTMDPATAVRVHRALYHTGRLGRDLFAFAQTPAGDLLPALRRVHGGLEACRPQSETLLELGQVNLAEHFAHEALEYEGERPDLLRVLARVNILKDRPQAARVFLNVLGQVPFQREWARRRLQDLEADPRGRNDPELERIRSRMVTGDLTHHSVPTESVLRQLLHTNRRNRMAFEYLMAQYLVTAQVEKVADEIGRLADFGYADIPRHYEEALLLHQQSRTRTNALLPRLPIRPATVRRFQEFSAAVQRRVQNTAEGRRDLARDFGDTLWHHYLSAINASEPPADWHPAP